MGMFYSRLLDRFPQHRHSADFNAALFLNLTNNVYGKSFDNNQDSYPSSDGCEMIYWLCYQEAAVVWSCYQE